MPLPRASKFDIPYLLGRHHVVAAFFKRHKLICINASLSELTRGL